VARHPGLSLRARLLIAFIALAFLPCLVLTTFVSEKLSRSLAFWGRPGVERTVDSSVGAARLALRALKDHLRDSVDGVAEGKPAPGGLDVLRIYERKDGRYTLSEAEPSAAELLLAPEAIEGALHSTRVIEREEGYILAVAALDSAAQRVVVGGYALPPDLFSQIAEARRGATFFDRLRLYLAVSRRWIWISTFLIAGLVLAGALWVARVISAGLTRPISGLVAAMERIGRGESAEALPVAGGPEMAYLVESFNRMAAELDRSRKALRRAERLAAWQDLARKVAHEINNPLTPIQFALHRLKRELAAGPQGVREALDAILGEVETLRHMAGEFSRLGKLPAPEFRPVDLAPLLQESAELYRSPEIACTVDLAPDLPAVAADPRLIRLVLVNLLKNAVEAMPGGGSIAIACRPCRNGERPAVEILVADHGPGIPPALLDRIGEPTVSAKPGGSGLGLAIALKILDDHGGTFELSNRAEGGALARITLTLARPGAGPELL
jgi:nitrogen fixation/metabolism regulation signal transduction histidine kinase